MTTPAARIKEVYLSLGTVLDRPESFGLGKNVPEPLLTALTTMREQLKDELMELRGNDDLSAELSQDTDSHSVPPAGKRSAA